MCWPDGTKYDGEWSQNMQHGIGEYTNQQGTTMKGRYVNGKRIEWIRPQTQESELGYTS